MLLLASVCWLVLVPAGTAVADELADCQQTGGIYVYIFQESREVTRGCTHAQTGHARIGELTTVAATSSGFICQIAGYPETCTEPDGSTRVYWTYWWWREGAWQYATEGGGHRGIPGSVEAWHYSAGEAPPLEPPTTDAGTPEATGSAAGPAGTSPAADQTMAPAGNGAGRGGPTATIVTVMIVLAGGAGQLIWRRRPRNG